LFDPDNTVLFHRRIDGPNRRERTRRSL